MSKGWFGQSFEHEADYCKAHESSDGSGVAFEVGASLRFRLIQAKVRLTIQRFGKTTKRCASLRLTICKVQQPVSATTFAIFGP